VGGVKDELKGGGEERGYLIAIKVKNVRQYHEKRGGALPEGPAMTKKSGVLKDRGCRTTDGFDQTECRFFSITEGFSFGRGRKGHVSSGLKCLWGPTLVCQ